MERCKRKIRYIQVMGDVGLVLEGGSFRGIFTAGVLDTMMEQNIVFSYVAGVSSGACNGVNFLSGQRGRTQKVILHENADPYYGVGQMVHSKKLLNLDKMLYDYSYEQIPLDFDAFFKNSTECEIAAANCSTGESDYLTADGDAGRLLAISKASCAVPLMSPPVDIDGESYMDGSAVDPIPYKNAVERCEKLVFVLTRREEEEPTDYNRMKALLKVVYRFPNLIARMCERREIYARQQNKIRELESCGRAFVIRPRIASIGHFENDSEKINAFYEHGCDIMNEKMSDLKAFIAS